MLAEAVRQPAGIAGWLGAWLLLLATMIPLHALEIRCQLAVTLRGGATLHRRLLVGVLRAGPPAAAGDSFAALFGRVLDLETVETFGAAGVQAVLFALLDLALLAAFLLPQAAARSSIALFLVPLVLSLLAVLAWRHLHARRRWIDSRLRLTRDLLERLLGHRTHLAQTAPGADDHSAGLVGYLDASRRTDRGTSVFQLLPRIALLSGLAVAAVGTRFTDSGNSPATSAVFFLGGLLLAATALGRLLAGLLDLADAAIACTSVSPLLGSGPPPPPTAALDLRSQQALASTGPLLTAHRLTLHPPGHPDPLLAACTVSIHLGDRILLTGDDPDAPSALAALLSGAAPPDRGVLLLSGLDRSVLGDDAWHRHVALATPADHLFAETLAFNLLLARPGTWTAADRAAATALCRDLGLGHLLARMPLGLDQLVGDAGWQLSAGERVRVFAARALLSRSPIVILDGLLDSLDAATTCHVLNSVQSRTHAALVTQCRGGYTPMTGDLNTCCDPIRKPSVTATNRTLEGVSGAGSGCR